MGIHLVDVEFAVFGTCFLVRLTGTKNIRYVVLGEFFEVTCAKTMFVECKVTVNQPITQWIPGKEYTK